MIDAKRVPCRAMTWIRKRWVQILGAGIVGIIIGSASSSGSSGPTKADLDAANKTAADFQSQAATAQQEAATAKSKAEADLAAQRAALDVREQKVSGLEAAAKANTFDGADGKYLVGVDIKAGTYRGTASDSCYYARLSSLDDSDIIENNNTSGPVVIRIKASDKAFQVKRCGTFTRIGD